MLPDDSSIYDAMIGPAPQQGPDQQAIAQALRRRSQLGQLGMLTTDPGMSAIGKSLTGEADNAAKQIQDTRQYDTTEADTNAQRLRQNKLGNDELGETVRNHDMENKLGYAHLQTMLDSANIKKGPNANQNQKFLETQAQKYSTSLSKDKIPDVEEAINNYEGFVKKYADQGQSAPGIGGLANFQTYSQVRGMANPEWNVGYGAAQTLRNIVSNMRFGSRQTQVELDRIKAELGGGVLTGQASDIALMEKLKGIIRAHKQNLSSGIHPAALALYKARNGETLDPVLQSSLDNALQGNDLIGGEVSARKGAKKTIKFSDLQP